MKIPFSTSELPKSLLCTLFLLIGTTYVWAQDSAVLKPDTYQNSITLVQNVLDEAIRSKKKVVSIPPGRYDFWPDGAIRARYFISNTSTEAEDSVKIRTIGLLLKGASHLTVEGNGALFVFHGKMTPFVIDGCNSVTLKNIKVDFEIPSMSEMRYVSVENGMATVAVHRDTRYSVDNGKVTWYGEGWKSVHLHAVEYDSTEKRLNYARWNTGKTNVTEISPGLLRFSLPDKIVPKPGNILTVRDIIRDQVGMFIYGSKNIELLNMNMHYMHGLGMVSQFSENITMRKVVCAPRPESGRIIASSADFMHFSGCKGKVVVDSCVFSGAHDDPINVHGTNLRIVRFSNPEELIVRFMHGQTYGFNAFFPGDTVALVRPSTMRRLTIARVKSAELLNDREMRIRLEKPLTERIDANDCLENLTWTPEVYIGHSRFERTNTRGLLMTTPRKVIIENNQFLRTGMSAILIEGDAEGWYESGAVKDITIRNNYFEKCAATDGLENATIAINPSNPKIDYRLPVHENIRIENNTFVVSDQPVLYAKSTAGIVFSGNTIRRSGPKESLNSVDLLRLNGCDRVEVARSRFEGIKTSEQIKVSNMPAGNVRVDDPGTVVRER